ncbi:MAG: radical SAM protein [Candidatus Aenigmarchaeota archaeon]|nr:radical SAM protein [Candidatus Aenigmarchaeota archaeon]
MKIKLLFLPWYHKGLSTGELYVYGCPNSCVYCFYSRYPLLGMKDPEEVAEDLKTLSKKYRTRYFFILNTEINPTYEYAESFADEIIKNDVIISWSDCATFKNMDAKLLRKLKEAGAARLIWGLESGSPRILDYIQKNVALSHVETCLKESYKIGIWNQFDMICGFPYEKETDIRLTISFLKQNKDYINEVTLNKFFIDGLFQRFPKKYGIRLKETQKIYRDWSTIPFDELNGMCWEKKIKQTLKFYDELMKAFAEFGIPGARPIHHVFHIINLQRNLDIKFSKVDHIVTTSEPLV